MKPMLIVCLTSFVACWCGCKEVFEKSLDKSHVTLLGPANNLVSGSANQSFFWQPIDSGINYELQVVSPTFDSIGQVVADTVAARNLLPLSLEPGKYQWRVRAFNSSSSTPFSAPWTLTVQ
ncbi:MAG TPA: hypothetical protein VNW04_23520 [Puia sp.]|jgi:hypothetical protein|nr:hypothetical protein [Puia sp.]